MGYFCCFAQKVYSIELRISQKQMRKYESFFHNFRMKFLQALLTRKYPARSLLRLQKQPPFSGVFLFGVLPWRARAAKMPRSFARSDLFATLTTKSQLWYHFVTQSQSYGTRNFAIWVCDHLGSTSLIYEQ